MKRLDNYEREISNAYEKGKLVSVQPSSAQVRSLRDAARATLLSAKVLKDKRVNIRLSSADLSNLQVRAREEGPPCQTLIASVLHKYVSGRLQDSQTRLTSRSTRTNGKTARAR